MTGMPRELEVMITPLLAAMGYDTVRVGLLFGEPPTLQILAEPASGAAMTVADCTAVSRQVSALLDAEDPVAGRYMLEVSSPGVDRPLVKAVDFERFTGRQVMIEARELIDGRRRFHGRLEGIEDGTVTICVTGEGEQDDKVFGVPFGEIAIAKLALPGNIPKGRKANPAATE